MMMLLAHKNGFRQRHSEFVMKRNTMKEGAYICAYMYCNERCCDNGTKYVRIYIYIKCVLVFRGCLMETMMMFDEFRRYDKLYVEKRKSSRVGRSVCMHTT